MALLKDFWRQQSKVENTEVTNSAFDSVWQKIKNEWEEN